MSERTGAIIINGRVENVILWGDETEAQLRADGFTNVRETTDENPRPGIGWLWDEEHGFMTPKPYDSWTWNGTEWVAPKPEPTTGGEHQWNEETQTWETIPEPEQPTE